jgi:hypothetical protein
MACATFMRLAGALLAIGYVGVADQSAAIRGKAVDPDGFSLRFPTVLLHEQSVERRYETTGDAQGQFRLEKVEPGLYVVDISVQGFRDKTLLIVHVAPGQRLDLGVLRLAIPRCSAPGVICDDFGLSVYNDPIHAQGAIKIPELCAVDIDEGKLVCNVGLDGRGADQPRPDLDSDFWVRIGASGEVYLTPRNGARLALNPPTEWSKSGCISASYSSKEVQINGLPRGSRICIRTSRDRYAQIEFFDVVPSGAETVKAAFITWQGVVDGPHLQNAPRK